MDVHGNDYCTILNDGNDEKYFTRQFYDIQKHLRKVIDSKGRLVSVFDYDLLGTAIHSANMESGQKWRLNDVTGQALYTWNRRRIRERYEYDILRRLTKVFIQNDTEAEYLT